MIHDNEIENIRSSANIVDVISSYIPLTQKGKNYFGVCPFHEDHSPSMSVSESKQIYKCFSCGAAGNVFTFVSDYENVSFIEAVKIVAEKCGLTFKGIKTKNIKVEANKLEYEIMDLALKFYQNNLNTKEGLLAKNYLNERSLKEDAIKSFDLGLALETNNTLANLLISKGYDINTLINLGLVNKKDEFINDIFKSRIMFPIHNLDGKCVGFTGRIYTTSDQAKYMNSKESVIFKKGSILFNYHRAKNEIKRKKEVIIVEGNMDAIRMYTNGIKNVIALMGTSLTDEQVSIIKNLRAKVILMFDNDSAGEAATYNNGNILEGSGITPYVVRLSGEKDPDEYIIKNGVEAILDNIKSPVSFLDFKLKYLKRNKDLTKTDDLVNYIKELIGSIKDIEDDLTKEIVLKKTSEEYEVPYELLKRELEKVTDPKKAISKKEVITSKVILSKYDKAAMNILYYMMNDSKYILRFERELGFFSKKKYRDIANEIIYYYEFNKTIDLAAFISFASTREISDDVKEIIKDAKEIDLEMNAFMESIYSLEKEENNLKIKELKEKIKTEFDENKKIKFAQELIKLKKGCVGNEK